MRLETVVLDEELAKMAEGKRPILGADRTLRQARASCPHIARLSGKRSRAQLDRYLKLHMCSAAFV
jgi:hypothetical protein